MKFFYFFLFSVILFLAIKGPVSAVGIGIKPIRLDLNVSLGKEVKTEILVINVSDEPAVYQLRPDSFVGEIKISPDSFILQPAENQLVEVAVKMRSSGLFLTNISAVARPLGGSGGFSAGSGIKIPITISSSGIRIWYFVFTGFLACLFIFFAVILIKGINRKVPHLN